MPIEIKFIIRYTGGSADGNHLDLYDAATSMQGLARSLSITSHALLNDAQVKSKGDSTKNVDFLLHPSKKGSFIEQVTIIFHDPAVQAIGSSVLASAFWDFIKYTWREATGRNGKLLEPKSRRIVSSNEDFSQEATKSLEIPLQQLHRPILNDKDIVIEIRRPKIGVVVKFNKSTLDYVMSQEAPILKINIKGNVTKYNNITGVGKFYDDNEGRTISFYSSELAEEERRILSWSLHNSNGDYSAGKIFIDVDVIASNSGSIKRYMIKDARR